MNLVELWPELKPDEIKLIEETLATYDKPLPIGATPFVSLDKLVMALIKSLLSEKTYTKQLNNTIRILNNLLGENSNPPKTQTLGETLYKIEAEQIKAEESQKFARLLQEGLSPTIKNQIIKGWNT